MRVANITLGSHVLPRPRTLVAMRIKGGSDAIAFRHKIMLKAQINIVRRSVIFYAYVVITQTITDNFFAIQVSEAMSRLFIAFCLNTVIYTIRKAKLTFLMLAVGL